MGPVSCIGSVPKRRVHPVVKKRDSKEMARKARVRARYPRQTDKGAEDAVVSVSVGASVYPCFSIQKRGP